MNNKYLLWIAILVVFCCGLVSCNLNNNHGNIEETSKTESMISDETTNLQNDENNMNDEVEEPSTSLESYEVYCNYILNNKSCLPEGFVTYEMLSSIGEFKSLVFPNDYDMEYYQYQIIGDDGFPIAVYVDHRNSENSSPNISTKQPVYLDKFPSDNMTYSERYKSETVVYNDIEYRYNADGDLGRIVIKIGKIEISFWPDATFVPNSNGGSFVYMKKFADYKSKEENILTQLLSGNRDNAYLESILKEQFK